MYCSKMIIGTYFIIGTIVHLCNTYTIFKAWGRQEYDSHLVAIFVKGDFVKIILFVCIWPYSMTLDASTIHTSTSVGKVTFSTISDY